MLLACCGLLKDPVFFSIFFQFLESNLKGLNLMIRELEDNLDDWLTDELDNYMDDDYLVFDCPGMHTYLSMSVLV